MATAFKECYLLSKRQAVISCLLKQKHKRRKNGTKKRKKAIISPAINVNGSLYAYSGDMQGLPRPYHVISNREPVAKKWFSTRSAAKWN